MELILKQPENKPPFIGILFTNIFEAERKNESMVKGYPECSFNLSMEPITAAINLILQPDTFSTQFSYTGVKYHYEALKKFLEATAGSPTYNFGHIIKPLDTHEVVRTRSQRKLFVVKLKSIKLIVEE